MNRMKHQMTGEDICAAAQALLAWCESQDMNPQDATRVLTTTLIAIIHEVAVSKGLRAKDGGQIIADIIMESLS